jgi:hypothetical protein
VKSLQPWCAKLMNQGGRTILVQTTLSVMIVHALMSLDVPPKTLDAFTKVCRTSLWKGQREVHSGHCLVAWDEVTTLKCFGGLEFLTSAFSTSLFASGGLGFSGLTPLKRGPSSIYSSLAPLWRSLRQPWWFSWAMGRESAFLA